MHKLKKRTRKNKRNNQVKKHVSQMSSSEINFLEVSLKNINIKDIRYSNHMKNKDIPFSEAYVENMLKNEKLRNMIVEYNETFARDGSIDKRVLLRDVKKKEVAFRCKKRESANLCIVISLNSFRVVTAYWNHSDDSHSNIDWGRYNEGLAIVS